MASAQKIHSLARTIVGRLQSQPLWVKCLSAAGICASLFVIRVGIQKIKRKLHKHPPRLHGLPIVGSVFTAILWKEEFFTKLLPQYGDIVEFYRFGSRLTVINDIRLLHKVFNKALNRLRLTGNLFTKHGFVAPIVQSRLEDGWQYRRKVIMRNITTILSKTEVESDTGKLCQEILFKEVENKSSSSGDGNLWYCRECIQLCVFNVIYHAIFGETLLDNKDKALLYTHTMDTWLTNVYHILFANALPFGVGKLMLSNQQYLATTSVKKWHNMTRDDYKQFIAKKSGNEDILDKTIAGRLYKDDKLDEETIVSDLCILLLAGFDTTAHATETGVLLLAKHQKIQHTIYEELNQAFGENGGKFCFSKLFDCPQFRAFANEAARISNSVPEGVHHTCDKNIRCVKIATNDTNDEVIVDYDDANVWKSKDFENILKQVKKGEKRIEYDYIIAKNSYMQANMRHICWAGQKVDGKGKNWQFGKEINLNHWLRHDGTDNKEYKFVYNKDSIPFGIGKRDCLGQALAMKEIDAFLANLILNYKILPCDENNPNFDINFTSAKSISFVDPAIPVRVVKRSLA